MIKVAFSSSKPREKAQRREKLARKWRDAGVSLKKQRRDSDEIEPARSLKPAMAPRVISRLLNCTMAIKVRSGGVGYSPSHQTLNLFESHCLHSRMRWELVVYLVMRKYMCIRDRVTRYFGKICCCHCPLDLAIIPLSSLCPISLYILSLSLSSPLSHQWIMVKQILPKYLLTLSLMNMYSLITKYTTNSQFWITFLSVFLEKQYHKDYK